MKTLLLTSIFILLLTQIAYPSCPSYYLYPGVCLDPGHGGPNACKWYPPCTNGDGYGSYGPNGLTEAWVNHEIVLLTKDLMLSEGIYVTCTKTSITEETDPQDRCNRANSDPDVDVFISVHHEGLPTVYDTRTFYMDERTSV
ncbi:MAG: N-acetylmuramoyl-L-alanine amidase [bacterium]